MLVTAVAWLYLLFVLLRRLLQQPALGCRRVPKAWSVPVYSTAKPAWVRQEIIRLKALMPLAGCRAISIVV